MASVKKLAAITGGDQARTQEAKPPNLNIGTIDNCSYGDIALHNARKIVFDSVNGTKHSELLKAAKLLGGYIAGGLIDENTAFQTLKTAIDAKDCDNYETAYKTIRKGFEYGKMEPITQDKKEQDRQNWLNENKRYNKPQPTPQLTPQPTSQPATSTIQQPTTKPAAALEDFEQWRITDKTNIPIQEPLILINGEIITTSDALTVISGASKSGKTALESVLIAGSIATSDYDGIEGIDILRNTNRKAVIHFDTEQSRWNHQQKHKTILHRANFISCPDFFLSYNIRKLDIGKYSTITKNICNAAQNQFNGIHSIWIDGGADYISDVNDAMQSNALVKFFDDLGSDYSCPVIVILHTNPGGEKERGHFGSQCQRKAEAILTVKNENDISYIDAKFLRHAGKGDVPQLQFVFDKSKGYHVGCGTRVNTPMDKTQKKAFQMQTICNDVFGGQCSYNYTEAINKIIGFSFVSERTAKTYFSTMNATGLIKKGDDNLWRKTF